MITPVIYLYRNKINNKVYVGQTLYEHRRFLAHKSAKRKSLFHNAVNKYGFDNFEYVILHKCISNNDDFIKEELNFWERFYIREFNSVYPNGYNLTDGGDGTSGYKFSDDTKTKMSVTRNDYYKSNDPYWKNKKFSYETRQKISNALKGRSLSDDTIKKLRSKRWYTNGIIEVFSDYCPAGYSLGRIKK